MGIFRITYLAGILTNTHHIGKLQVTHYVGVAMQQVLSVPSQLGVLLKAARKEAGISQVKLAERLGISQSRMSHMELNPGSVSLEQLLALFGALGLEIMVGSKNPAKRSTAQAPDAGHPSARHVANEPPAPEW
ncbi:helix-turn-helix domain-containing protein [Variovorax beijingensis]|jgi:HTH-type transcriptional regulator/antitoxin HipB